MTNLFIGILALTIAGITAWWQFFRKPKIELLYEDNEPYRKLLHLTGDPDSYNVEWFIRVKVLNNRKVIAKNCFGKLSEWYTNNEMDKYFDPIKLHWVSNDQTDYSSIDLAYQEFDYLDLVYTDKNKNKIRIYTNSHLRGVNFEFGLMDEHIFKVSFYAENEISKFEYFKISYQKDDPDGKLIFVKVIKLSKKEIN